MTSARKKLPPETPVVSGAVDDGMAYALLTWAYSLHNRTGLAPHFVIGFLEGRLSAKKRNTLGSALQHLSISHEFVALPQDSRFIQQGHISPTTFAKFQLADLLSGTHVWIDIDTIATDGWARIFSEISAAPAESKLIVATRDDSARAHSDSPPKPHGLAFNAGVLGWPARHRVPWSGALDSAELVATQEQHLFNTLYDGQIHTVSEKFNTLTYRYDQLDNSDLPFITHYAGAHKPWHVPRQFAPACVRHRCPWSLWFEVEEELLSALDGHEGLPGINALRAEALRSGRLGLSGDQRGRAFLHLLRVLGPAGWLLLAIAKLVTRFIPRGTHPLH